MIPSSSVAGLDAQSLPELPVRHGAHGLDDRDSCALYDIPELFLKMVVLIRVAASSAISQ
jgi:hypothetical protein